MRQGPHQKRGRGRGNRRSNTPNRNQTFDSNGPDVRIRGNASQVYEKYLNLARDATASGDRVLAESYYQHAEHYYRILSAFQDAQGGESRGQPFPGSAREWDQDDDDRDGDDRGEQSDRPERQDGSGNGRDRGDWQGRDQNRGDQSRGDQNRGDQGRNDQGRGDQGRGDQGRDRGDRFNRDRGDRRQGRPEGEPETRGDRFTSPAPQQPAEQQAAEPRAIEPKVVEPPVEDVRAEAAPTSVAPASVAPASEPTQAEEDGIRRTLRLAPSRASRTASVEPAVSEAEPAQPKAAAAPEAVDEPAAPAPKPRRRRAAPKAEEKTESESFVTAPVVDDDGAVAAS